MSRQQIVSIALLFATLVVLVLDSTRAVVALQLLPPPASAGQAAEPAPPDVDEAPRMTPAPQEAAQRAYA